MVNKENKVIKISKICIKPLIFFFYIDEMTNYWKLTRNNKLLETHTQITIFLSVLVEFMAIILLIF
jgi:hypothetical protein